MNKEILEAARILNEGGIIIFPTDTAFGIGCRMDNEKSVERLFRIRKRPRQQATPVLVNGISMAQKYLLEVPLDVKDKLIDNFWPGALTIVLKCEKNKVPALVRGEGDNLGVRMPDSKEALALIEKIGVPILGPSANFHGEKTPYNIADLDPNLVYLVDYVLDGNCKLKMASTVIDCTSNPWQILRKGAIEVNI